MEHIFKKLAVKAMILALFNFVVFSDPVSADVSSISVDYVGLGSFSPIHTFGATEQVEIFKGVSAKFKLSGSWIDITSEIKLVALDGQATTNVIIPKTGNSFPGVNPAILEFTIFKELSGRYRVVMSRAGGSDNITVNFNFLPIFNQISPLTLTGAPAYLNAFKYNTDIRMRVSGSFLKNLTLEPSSRNEYSIVNQNYVANTAGIKEVVIKVSIPSNSFTLKPGDFTIRYGSKSFDVYKLTSWNNEFAFPVYDKPNLVLQGSLSNLYKKQPITAGSCNIKNQNLVSIPNPSRCANLFAVPNPTVSVPLTEAFASMPAPSITIKNDSYAPIFTPFTVEFRFGLTVLQSVTVNQMIALETKTITYNRPVSKKLLYRSLNCPDCYEDANAPYNWEDPNITVVIDPSAGVTTGPGVIAESNEGDNSATFNQ